MNGRVEVASREGQGSRFSIILPAIADGAVAEGSRKLAS